MRQAREKARLPGDAFLYGCDFSLYTRKGPHDLEMSAGEGRMGLVTPFFGTMDMSRSSGFHGRDSRV